MKKSLLMPLFCLFFVSSAYCVSPVWWKQLGSDLKIFYLQVFNHHRRYNDLYCDDCFDRGPFPCKKHLRLVRLPRLRR